MSERLPVPETLHQAFESAKNLPTDWELAQQKAAGWESLQKKRSRTDRWRRWKPVAGVLAGAAVVFAVVLTGQALHQTQDGSGQPAAANAAKPAGKSDVKKAVKTNPANLADVYEMRRKAYRDQGMDLLVTDPTTQGDLVRQGSKLLLVKDAQQDVLLEVDPSTTIQPISFSGSNVIVQTQSRTNVDGAEQYYLLDLVSKKSSQLPLRHDSYMQVSIWQTQHPQIVYTSMDTEKQVESLIAYDPANGSQETLYQTPANRIIERLITNGDHLLIGWRHELQVRYGNDWKLVARDDNATINYVNYSQNADVVIYQVVDGLQQVSSSDVLNKGSFFSINLKTGQNQKLLPDALPGEQQLVMGRAETHPYYLITDFIVDPMPEQTKLTSYEMTGKLQFWQLPNIGGKAKMIYEKHVKGNERYLYANIMSGQQKLEEYQLVQPQQNAKWWLLYNPEQGTIKEQVATP